MRLLLQASRLPFQHRPRRSALLPAWAARRLWSRCSFASLSILNYNCYYCPLFFICRICGLGPHPGDASNCFHARRGNCSGSGWFRTCPATSSHHAVRASTHGDASKCFHARSFDADRSVVGRSCSTIIATKNCYCQYYCHHGRPFLIILIPAPWMFQQEAALAWTSYAPRRVANVITLLPFPNPFTLFSSSYYGVGSRLTTPTARL